MADDDSSKPPPFTLSLEARRKAYNERRGRAAGSVEGATSSTSTSSSSTTSSSDSSSPTKKKKKKTKKTKKTRKFKKKGTTTSYTELSPRAFREYRKVNGYTSPPPPINEVILESRLRSGGTKASTVSPTANSQSTTNSDVSNCNGLSSSKKILFSSSSKKKSSTTTTTTTTTTTNSNKKRKELVDMDSVSPGDEQGEVEEAPTSKKKKRALPAAVIREMRKTVAFHAYEQVFTKESKHSVEVKIQHIERYFYGDEATDQIPLLTLFVKGEQVYRQLYDVVDGEKHENKVLRSIALNLSDQSNRFVPGRHFDTSMIAHKNSSDEGDIERWPGSTLWNNGKEVLLNMKKAMQLLPKLKGSFIEVDDDKVIGFASGKDETQFLKKILDGMYLLTGGGGKKKGKGMFIHIIMYANSLSITVY